MNTDIDLEECITLFDLSDPLDSIKLHLSADTNNTVMRSPIPSMCETEECIVGIDEAGRGPVLGPMVYGICYCVKKEGEVLKKLGCADSKSLTEEKREDIFKRMCQEIDSLTHLGWAVDVISPNQISNCMLRRQKYSLNEISHGSAISLIKLLQKNKVNVTEVYIDTVGPPEKYEEKLSRIFRDIKIKVSKKADSLFPVVSAASICAKVIRDLALKNWKFSEHVKINEETGWGSGYPGDANTKAFLTENMDPVFGFPQIVRFGWSTASNILDEKGVPIEWSDDEDNINTNGTNINTFFKSGRKPLKHSYFADRHLETVDTL